LITAPLALLLVAFRAQPAQAIPISWNNAAGGNWNTDSNWNPAQVPGASDDVLITLAGTYTVTLDVSPTVASLSLGGSTGVQTLSASSQTLTIDGPSTINGNGALRLINATVAGSGSLTNNGQLTVQSSSNIDTSFLSGDGSVLRMEGRWRTVL
jgi:hypothetical protein